MNTRMFAIALLVSCALLFTEGRDPTRGGKASATPGADIFLKGDYLEIAVNPAGTFGSRAPGPGAPYEYGGSSVPEGYHSSPRSSKLGVVVDTGKDGWTVGNPAQSGDAFLEGTPDQGFHVSWHGPQGSFERFNQMPLFDDDDDADTTTSPYRGCITCENKETPNVCDPFSAQDTCNCNTDTTAENYICDFKRWDIDTEGFEEVTDEPEIKKVRWVGVAIAKQFESATSGHLHPTGEKLMITKDIYFQQQGTVVFEQVQITNIGEVTLYNVSLLWSIVPTIEAFPHDGWSTDKDIKFANRFTTPFQGTYTNPKTLVKSVGKDLGYTVAIGTQDVNARAWHMPRRTWMADQDNSNLRPYSGDLVLGTPRSVDIIGDFREDVALLAIRIPSIAPTDLVTKTIFWAFTEDAINEGFNGITPDTSVVPVGDARCPSTGNCCEVHSSIGCTNPCFSDCVCDEIFGGNAPECCESAWTQDCVDLLEKLLVNGTCSAGRISACDSSCADVHTCVPAPSDDTTGQTTDETSSSTSGDSTSGDSTSSDTTGDVTTGIEVVTTGAATTGDATTSPVTTASITTASVEVTTASVTTSPGGGNTNETVTTGLPAVSTGDPSAVPDAVNDRNAKIIGAVFGVAGFLILILIIAAIILAVRASKSNK